MIFDAMGWNSNSNISPVTIVSKLFSDISNLYNSSSLQMYKILLLFSSTDLIPSEANPPTWFAK